MLTRRQFAALAALQAPRRPNVLFVLCGGWRRQAIPPSDPAGLQAPNLVRLLREGLWFPRAYAVNPASTPARAALQTGRYPHSAGTPWNHRALPDDQSGLASAFAAAGYATGYIGLWDLDGDAEPGFVPPGPRRRGFRYWAAFNRGRRYTNGTYFRDENKPIPADGFEPDAQTALAIDFLRKERSEPFFLQISYGPPHSPDPGQTGSSNYYTLCTAIDKNIGKLLAALKERRIAENTIVVFTSDTGELESEDWREPSAGIPLLLRWPGRLEAGSRQDWLCNSIDIAPTLCGLCGLAPLESAQGVDRAKLILAGGVGERPESLYAQGRLGTPEEWRMVVRGWDKLVVDRDLKVTHLYNLAQDPKEQDNLAVDRATIRRQEELLALMRRWIITTGDRVPYPGRVPAQEKQ